MTSAVTSQDLTSDMGRRITNRSCMRLPMQVLSVAESNEVQKQNVYENDNWFRGSHSHIHF